MRVKSSEGLVEQQHRGISGERPCEGDTLTLAAGKIGRACVREVRDSKPLEQLRSAFTSGVRDVCANAQVREQGVLLEDEADAPLLRPPDDPALGVEPDVVAVRDATVRSARQPGDHPEHRCLACP